MRSRVNSADRPIPEPPTWRRILASYVLVAAIPVVLWASTHPLLAAGLVVTVLATGVTVRGVVRRLLRRRAEHRIRIRLGDRVAITVCRSPADCAP